MAELVKSTKNPSDVTNPDFVRGVFGELPKGCSSGACTLSGDPAPQDEEAKKRLRWIPQRSAEGFSNSANNYTTLAAYRDDGGRFRIATDICAGVYAIMLDDIGSKIFKYYKITDDSSCLLETSPGNFQAGFIFDAPVSVPEATRVINTLIEYQWTDPGASSPATRWARLPEGVNGKAKYKDEAGQPFRCRLEEWRPHLRYTPEGVLGLFDLAAPPEKPPAVTPRAPSDCRFRVADVQRAKSEISGAPQGSRRRVLTRWCLWAAELIQAELTTFESAVSLLAEAGAQNGIAQREIEELLRWSLKAKARELADREPRDENALLDALIHEGII